LSGHFGASTSNDKPLMPFLSNYKAQQSGSALWWFALQEHQLWYYNPLPFLGKPFSTQESTVAGVSDANPDK